MNGAKIIKREIVAAIQTQYPKAFQIFHESGGLNLQSLGQR